MSTATVSCNSHRILKGQEVNKLVLKKTVLFFASIAMMFVLLGCAAPQPAVEQTGSVGEQPVEPMRLSLEDAKATFDDGSGLFLDVRSESSYTASHIPGAFSIPLAELESRMTELNPDQWIITYCT